MLKSHQPKVQDHLGHSDSTGLAVSKASTPSVEVLTAPMPIPPPMVATEEDLVEAALLKYAQQQATKWGADRFAAEFKRRDLEERWLEASRSHTTPYSQPSGAPDGGLIGALSGPVDAAAQERVVEADRAELRFLRPKYERHASVPRPPEPEPEPDRGRGRRRKRSRSATNDPSWLITPAEASRMSAAGRRLYGLDDPSTARA